MGIPPFFHFLQHLNCKTLRKAICWAFQRRLIGLSAEIAYNAILALFPTILVILTALSLFEASLQTTVKDLARQYQDVIPEVAWNLLRDFAREITQTKSKSLFSLSFIVTIWVSSGALSAAMNALDIIQHIPRRKKRPFWKAKLISIIITISTIILLVMASFFVLLGDSLVKFAVDLIVHLPVSKTGASLLTTLWRLLSGPLALGVIAMTVAFVYQIVQAPNDQKHPFRKAKLILSALIIASICLIFLILLLVFINDLIIRLKFDYSVALILVKIWRFFSLPVALAIVSVAFAFIYRVGPSYWLVGTPLFPGAILAALSWGGVSALFRLYVSNFSQYNKVYGAVGAVIILMLWLQLSALVMLLGYQINVTLGQEIRKKKQKEMLS